MIKHPFIMERYTKLMIKINGVGIGKGCAPYVVANICESPMEVLKM